MADSQCTQIKRKSPSHRGGKPLLTREKKLEKQRARSARWRARHREELREYFAKYRAANNLKAYYAEYYKKHKAHLDERSRRPDVRLRARGWRQRTKEVRNAKRREWDRLNPERAKQIARRSRERRRDKKRESDRLYRQQKPETYKASIARAKAAKPEHYRAIQVQSQLRRRARLKNIPVESVSHKAIRARDRMRCHICGEAIRGRATFDHLIPVLRRGAHAEWNLMLAHDRCNKRRGTKALFCPESKEEALRYIAARIARYAQEIAA